MIGLILIVGTFTFLGIPAALVLIPWAMVTGNATPLYNASMAIARAGLFLARVRIEVAGLELVPEHTACVFMANHVSNLDPPALLPHIPGRTSVFIKRELTKIPVLGYGLRLGEFIPVDRDGRVQSAQQSIAEARDVLAKGIHITTFVEGTRSPDGRMLPFKKGPFYLAQETGVPCVPVSIYGTEVLMGKGKARIKPGTAHIIFHSPINPADYETREQLSDAMREVIASGLPEWMRS